MVACRLHVLTPLFQCAGWDLLFTRCKRKRLQRHLFRYITALVGHTLWSRAFHAPADAHLPALVPRPHPPPHAVDPLICGGGDWCDRLVLERDAQLLILERRRPALVVVVVVVGVVRLTHSPQTRITRLTLTRGRVLLPIASLILNMLLRCNTNRAPRLGRCSTPWLLNFRLFLCKGAMVRPWLSASIGSELQLPN